MKKSGTQSFWIWVAVLTAILAALIVINILVRLPHGGEQTDPRAAESLSVSAEPAVEETVGAAEEPEVQETTSVETAAPRVGEMQSVIRGVTDSSAGAWSVYYESLAEGSYGSSADVGGSDKMVSASLIKLFIMGAVYQEIESGILSHDAVYSDIYSMITASDNDAANRLVRALGNGDAAAGMGKVNSFARSIGCSQSEQNRLMLDNNGLQNYVSARDCGVILRMIYEGRCVSQTWSAEMLNCLRAQTVNNRLPAQLPSGVSVAHKTGDLSNLSCGDVGIIFTQHGNYILCVINNQSPDDGQTARDIASLSAQVYAQFTGSGGR